MTSTRTSITKKNLFHQIINTTNLLKQTTEINVIGKSNEINLPILKESLFLSTIYIISTKLCNT